MKIVVFDLDETLGYFTQFGIFWDSLSQCLHKQLTQDDFNTLLDLYPEFLRPNIVNILLYLKQKKRENCCHKMMIYTNNNGPKEWCHHIISYFEKKINYNIIDQIIAAFKVRGKTVEICRTSHHKTHGDLIRCTKIDPKAEICFLDDTFYPGMEHNNIYYINVKPYFHDIQFSVMLDRLCNSNYGINLIADTNTDKNEFREKMMAHIQQYHYDCVEKNEKENEIDTIIGKHIVTHLHAFFDKPKRNKTLKYNVRKRQPTTEAKKHNKTYKK